MPDYKKLKDEFSSYVTEVRRYLHAHPELSHEEKETSLYLQRELAKDGIPFRTCGKRFPWGILAEIRGGTAGKTVLLRSDMDALPIEEKTGLPFASEAKGVMHACCHDTHMAMLLTAARMLNRVKDELRGTVRILFEPSEETGEGAADMLEGGCAEGVDFAWSMHAWPALPAGHVSIEDGPRMGATDEFRVDVKGLPGHAAAPHLSVDATLAAASIATALQTIVSREVHPASTVVVTIGQLHSGTRWNVVSGDAFLDGTIRCFREKDRKTAQDGITRISESIARAHGCTAKSSFRWAADAVVNDPSVSAAAREAATEVLGADALATTPATLVGEDFAVIMDRVPSAFGLFGTGRTDGGTSYPLHNERCSPDESGLIQGALLHTAVAFRLLNGKA